MTDLSVVIPTYGGHSSIGLLIAELETILEGRGLDYEIVVVNDCSPDDTWQLLQKMTLTHDRLRAIDLLRNHGQARATLCGLAHARGRIVATMDDDLQQPPEELLVLLDALEANPAWDAAVGYWSRDEGWARNFGSRMHARVDHIASGTPLDYRHSSFRAMRRPLIDALLEHETRTPVLGPLMRQTSSRIHNVPVQHRDRPHGASTFRFIHGVRSVTSNLLATSTLPLRLLSTFGLVMSLLALLTGTALVVRAVVGFQTPPGWASAVLAVVFFGGAALLGIGLLGEYMRFLLTEVRRAPRWGVREHLGDGSITRGRDLAVRGAVGGVDRTHSEPQLR